jgi:hypothetical protein
VILGLLVLALCDLWTSGGARLAWWAVASAGGLAYLAAVAFGLGLPRVAKPLVLLVALIAGAVLAQATTSTSDLGIQALNAVGRWASAFLLGAMLSAMLLGHYYLTAPAMSIEPLKRFVRCIGWGLAARAIVAALGWWSWQHGSAAIVGSQPAAISPFFFALRWGVGIVGTAVATVLVWKTVQIRSTQSATGILYAALMLLLCGELSALIVARTAGVPL